MAGVPIARALIKWTRRVTSFDLLGNLRQQIDEVKMSREDDPRVLRLLKIWEEAYGMWLKVQAAGVNTPERAALVECAVAWSEVVGVEYNILVDQVAAEELNAAMQNFGN